MLSSTFSKYGEVELQVSGSGTEGETKDILFLRLEEQRLSLNGTNLDIETMVTTIIANPEPMLVVSVQSDVTAQRMADVLVALREAPETQVVLLGDG